MLKMSCPGLDMWYTPSTSTSARAGAGGAGRSRGACCETARMTAAIVVAGRLGFMQFSFVGQPAQRRCVRTRVTVLKVKIARRELHEDQAPRDDDCRRHS